MHHLTADEHQLLPDLLERAVARAEQTRAWEDISEACGQVTGAQCLGADPELIARFRNRTNPLFAEAMQAARERAAARQVPSTLPASTDRIVRASLSHMENAAAIHLQIIASISRMVESAHRQEEWRKEFFARLKQRPPENPTKDPTAIRR